MSVQIYLKYKYSYENIGFCILCVVDPKTLKLFEQTIEISNDFHRETSQAPTPSPPPPPPPPPPPQRSYDVSRGQNRYVKLPFEKNLHSLNVFYTSHIYEVFLPSSKSFISTFTPRYGPKRELIAIFFVVKTPIPASGIIEGFTYRLFGRDFIALGIFPVSLP